MKLFYFRSPSGLRNFGDDLNPWLWGRLIPRFLDDDENTLFVGIGTILNNRLPKARRTVVMGSGVGYGSGLPTIDDSWKIYCLRGPLSAQSLGVSQDLAVADPAILVRKLFHVTTRKEFSFAYMPHAASSIVGKITWNSICQELGILFIDPCWPIDEVLSSIGKSEILITEAMHGAIAADALRVPWIPVNSNTILRFKWLDWCMSIGVEYKPKKRVINLYDGFKSEPDLFSKTRKWIKRKYVMTQLNDLLKNGRPTLSNESCLNQKICDIEERLSQFKKDVDSGFFK